MGTSGKEILCPHIYYLVFVSPVLDINQVNDNDKFIVNRKFIVHFSKMCCFSNIDYDALCRGVAL